MQPARASTNGFLLLALAALALTPFVLPFWITGDGWWPEILNLGHFIGFAVLTGVCLLGCEKLFPRLGYWPQLFLAVLLVSGLAVATEWLQQQQFFRTGSWRDVGLNLAGVLFAVLCSVARRCSIWPRRLLLAGLVLLTAVPLWPLASEYSWYQARKARLPVLLAFDSGRDAQRVFAWKAEQVTQRELRAPVSYSSWYRQPAGKMTIIRFPRIWAHWGGYDRLNFVLESHCEPAVGEARALDPNYQFVVYFLSERWQATREHAFVNLTLTNGRQSAQVALGEFRTGQGERLNFDTARILSLELRKLKQAGACRVAFQRGWLS